MTVIEVEVHSLLRAFLRTQDDLNWPHQLTMARLVARALRLGRPALVQTGSARSYCLSYLTPALLWNAPVILVAPPLLQQRLLQVEIPQLQRWFQTSKAVCIDDGTTHWQNFSGLLLVSPQAWLEDRLTGKGRFPQGVPTLIDRADDLEEWTREQLTTPIQAQDWDELIQCSPHLADRIRDARVQLAKSIFSHPRNPYQCHLLDSPEQETLHNLFVTLERASPEFASPYLETSVALSAFSRFWQQWRSEEKQLLWAAVDREHGQFTLDCAPVSVASALSSIWSQQPVVLIGGFLDWETSAPVYRQQLGLGDLTCLRFSPDRQTEQIQLYSPDGLPMPNTPQFQAALMQQIRTLLALSSVIAQPVVILVGDMPLKTQVAANMAAEFGSRVQVEKTDLEDNSILISGWEFWRSHQEVLPTPQLIIIATLPIPSLENPLVAGRVAFYKHQRKDWFRLYLLPTALRELQRSVVALRESQGVVALLDNRVNHRSYGKQILTALDPYARVNYIEGIWLKPEYLNP